LSNHDPRHFESLLFTRAVDAAIGPRPADLDASIASTQFLNFQVIAVAAPDHAMTRIQPGVGALREQTWLLGPSAAYQTGVIPEILRRISVPEEHQRIFQSHAAAVEEVKRGKGLALAVSFSVSQDLANGDLRRVAPQILQTHGAWSILT